jgi:hypothetical protein
MKMSRFRQGVDWPTQCSRNFGSQPAGWRGKMELIFQAVTALFHLEATADMKLA